LALTRCVVHADAILYRPEFVLAGGVRYHCEALGCSAERTNFTGLPTMDTTTVT